MESVNELVIQQKPIMLDDRGYGRWKVRMVQLIRNLGEDAWTAVEEGWEPPYEKTEAGDKIIKPKARWTVEEKSLSKYNARALNAIFGAVDDDEFKLLQGCESAKEAWDILQKSHEGNSSVKRTRLDQLPSQFEVLRMDPKETISQFSAKMSSIANEAKNLGKVYKNTKLVKKLIRCLPSKYAAHKAVMRVSGNTDTLKFEDLVGMLKSEEMEVAEEQRIHGKGIAFKADDTNDQLKEIKDNMSLMARNFGKALKRVEKGQGRESSRWNRNDGERSGNRFNRTEKEKADHRKEVQCHECSGFGHYKPECPLTKRKEMKCFECKGFGHVKTECPNLQKTKNKSFISFSDSESDSDEEEGILNLFAFSVKSDDVLAESSDDDEEESVTKESYCALYDNWVQLCNEKLLLVKEKLQLEAKVNMLEGECRSEVSTCNKSEVSICKEPLSAEKDLVERKLRNLQDLYGLEKEKSTRLERELNENHKKIRMLNNGGNKLDEILSMGIVGSQHRGLGYNKQQDVELLSRDKSVNFRRVVVPAKTREPQVKSGDPRQSWTDFKQRRNEFICFHCGKAGHVRRFCFKFKNKIKELWMARKCFIDPFHFSQVWVAKKDLYSKVTENNERKYDQAIRESEEINLCCNLSVIISEEEPSRAQVAFTSTSSEGGNPWYFDSGCSRHMTGNPNISTAYEETPGGKVTFGDGGKGSIRGKGQLEDVDQPSLINVYYVEGLKANLISISQLCDEGLRVIFTKVDCQAVDENNNTV
ncbi:PREDICTED: uncharacterized protein LOC104759742 [Camelina sativa]|uniref:Uncharacterized protein LOC104759742 n=1 Tax=Camelina sativa TaxID=90675 RepID=A0ABM0X5A9_CAMSA|nr:PREDICTED: uncharacterized protein LOC104759742 [Camelina sativa]